MGIEQCQSEHLNNNNVIMYQDTSLLTLIPGHQGEKAVTVHHPIVRQLMVLQLPVRAVPGLQFETCPPKFR